MCWPKSSILSVNFVTGLDVLFPSADGSDSRTPRLAPSSTERSYPFRFLSSICSLSLFHSSLYRELTRSEINSVRSFRVRASAPQRPPGIGIEMVTGGMMRLGFGRGARSSSIARRPRKASMQSSRIRCGPSIPQLRHILCGIPSESRAGGGSRGTRRRARETAGVTAAILSLACR